MTAHASTSRVAIDDGDVQIYHGDVCDVLRQLPEGAAQTCVTSPPYWGLRDYGTGTWTGGDADCDHQAPPTGGPNPERYTPGGGEMWRAANDKAYQGECGRCGARRVDQQLGLEASPELYVERMVAVFREVWRVLRDDGTVWLNLGDSYNAGRNGGWAGGKGALNEGRDIDAIYQNRSGANVDGLKPKDLVGIPWRAAFALQTDGWYLRGDIIWSKPNPMPESVTDRPTKAHEYVFLLSKRPRYFYDADAVREPGEPFRVKQPDGWDTGPGGHGSFHRNGREAGRTTDEIRSGRNLRSVWEVATEPFPEAHFATYPQALVRRCILAGTSERGECSQCGASWVRETSTEYENPGNRTTNGGRSLERRHETAGFPVRLEKRTETKGWRPSCDCCVPNERAILPEVRTPDTRPQTVLDPFIGSGTTALVARRLNRRAVGIDLSVDYLQIAARRTQQLSLLGGAA